MKLAIGIILSSGYRADTEFLFGRAPDKDPLETDGMRQYPPEGLVALSARIQTGQANATLPDALKVTDCRTIVSRKFPTDVARNEICAGALAYGCDYLLFLDADMVHPADMFERLLAHDKPVITARYHTKKAPFSSTVYVKHRTETGPHCYSTVHFGRGVFEIERGGAGALLIRRDVLEAIKKRQEAVWQGIVASAGMEFTEAECDLLDIPLAPTCEWFRYQRGPKAPYGMTVSEDYWFFKQAREAGFKCYVDWDIDVPHVGSMPIDGSFNAPFLSAQMAEYENPDRRDDVLSKTVVMGYADGMQLGDDPADRIPEYVVTAGER